MAKKFWSFRNIVETNKKELVITGPISDESWWGDEATPSQLRQELSDFDGDELTVSLNSGGGDVFAGLEMYNALRELDAKVTIRVDGLAASIASIIAMAGDKIIMSPGSLMMIHRPSVFAGGNVDDLDKAKTVLLKIEESITPIYSERSGLSIEKIAELLEAETWMTADEAVEMGFADEAIHKSDLKTTVQNVLNTNFAFSMKATEESLKSLVEKVTANEAEEVENVVEPIETEAPVETETSVDTEIKEETKTEEVVDTTVEEIKTSTKEENDMEDNKTIAASQVIEPSMQATVTPKVDMKSYLKTEASMEAFARILEENPGEMGGISSDKVRNSWKNHLEATMGVTNPEIFLPQPLITAIQNAFEDGGKIWNLVSKVGSDVWNAAWDTEDDVNSNDGRGRGYNRADAEDKAEEVLTFDERILRPQFVYKYITLNKEDIKEQRSTGALVTYVLSELPQRIVREVERAIVIGDGRASDDDYKIKEGNPRGFYPILADAIAGNYFADVVTLVGDESKAEAVAKALDEIKTPGTAVLIAKKGYSTAARFEKDIDGRLLFPLGAKASDVLGIDTIIEPDWFNDVNSPNYDAIVVVLSGYKVVGDTSIEGFSNFILKTNKQEYLQEIWAGGGLSQKRAAIAIPVATS